MTFFSISAGGDVPCVPLADLFVSLTAAAIASLNEYAFLDSIYGQLTNSGKFCILKEGYKKSTLLIRMKVKFLGILCAKCKYSYKEFLLLLLLVAYVTFA